MSRPSRYGRTKFKQLVGELRKEGYRFEKDIIKDFEEFTDRAVSVAQDMYDNAYYAGPHDVKVDKLEYTQNGRKVINLRARGDHLKFIEYGAGPSKKERFKGLKGGWIFYDPASSRTYGKSAGQPKRPGKIDPYKDWHTNAINTRQEYGKRLKTRSAGTQAYGNRQVQLGYRASVSNYERLTEEAKYRREFEKRKFYIVPEKDIKDFGIAKENVRSMVSKKTGQRILLVDETALKRAINQRRNDEIASGNVLKKDLQQPYQGYIRNRKYKKLAKSPSRDNRESVKNNKWTITWGNRPNMIMSRVYKHLLREVKEYR